VPYLSTSVVVIHYEEALYQVYTPYTFIVTQKMNFLGWEIVLAFRSYEFQDIKNY